jgi:hypothetical protein
MGQTQRLEFENYFVIVCPCITVLETELETEKEKTTALDIANSINADFKTGKIVLRQEYVTAEVGMILKEFDDFNFLFFPMFESLQEMVNDFIEKWMKNKNAGIYQKSYLCLHAFCRMFSSVMSRSFHRPKTDCIGTSPLVSSPVLSSSFPIL